MRPPKPPKHVWADYDSAAPRGIKWAFYNTKAEQRSNRPDLKPIKLRVVRREDENTDYPDGVSG